MAEAILVGLAGSPGVGIGRLLPVGVPEASVVAADGDHVSRRSSDERQRLLDAMATAATALESLAIQVSARAGEDIGAIFEAQALFARDPGIVEPAIALVESGQPPDVATVSYTHLTLPTN